jgi:dCMP deaminase
MAQAQGPRERLPWDEYFMKIAEVVASRSTCPRKFVGAVIVRDKTILSTGYNGSIRGMPHCSDVGHMMENDHCVATIHAEANAIIQAAKNGVNIGGSAIRNFTGTTASSPSLSGSGSSSFIWPGRTPLRRCKALSSRAFRS